MAIGISAILAIASMAASAASAAASAAKKAKAKRAEQAEIARQQAELNKEQQEGYLNQAGAQAALNASKERAEEQSRQMERRASLSGATNEAKLAAQDNINKGVSNTIRGVAAGADEWQRDLKNRKGNLNATKINSIAQDKADAQAGVAAGVSGMMSAAGSLAGGFNNNNGGTIDNSFSNKQYIDEQMKNRNLYLGTGFGG